MVVWIIPRPPWVVFDDHSLSRWCHPNDLRRRVCSTRILHGLNDVCVNPLLVQIDYVLCRDWLRDAGSIDIIDDQPSGDCHWSTPFASPARGAGSQSEFRHTNCYRACSTDAIKRKRWRRMLRLDRRLQGHDSCDVLAQFNFIRRHVIADATDSAAFVV